jgi:UTP:GlnB (protein PII) uridylyltransferase
MAGLLYLVKKAAPKSTGHSVLRDAANIVGSVGLATGGVMLADKAINLAGEQMFKAKTSSYIRYAIKKHPELKEVGESTLKKWLLALYTLSPKLANNEELAADALYQIYKYGGNFDLATAKMLSDITKGTKHDNIPYIAAGNQVLRGR